MLDFRKRCQRLNGTVLSSVGAGIMLGATRCYAAMPWEGPLETIQESVTGPVATGVCTIIVVVTGIAIACGEGGGAGRRLLQGVCGLALALGVASFISSFG